MTFKRAGNADWPDPAHRLVSLSVSGHRLMYGVCGYLSDYRLPGGTWHWAGKAHGGETQDAPAVWTHDEKRLDLETRANLHVSSPLSSIPVVVARRLTHHSLTMRDGKYEYERVDVLESLTPHEQRVEYVDMLPLTRMSEDYASWSMWESGDVRGRVQPVWGSAARSKLYEQASVVIVDGPYASLNASRDMYNPVPRTRVVDRPETCKLYAVTLDAMSTDDQVRSVAAGEIRFHRVRWDIVVK